MSEKPILFSNEMVQAILDGRKTQTRRVIKPQPSRLVPGDMFFYRGEYYPTRYLIERFSPYGQPGDLLWVRETWATNRQYDHLKPSLVPPDSDLWWFADKSSYRTLNGKPGKKRPSIFMPRWASRITLQVTGVRVERVQDISEADAQAEGVDHNWLGADPCPPEYENEWRNYLDPDCDGPPCYSPRNSFRTLWNSINAKRGYGWDVNPWVWVVEFDKC